MDEEVGEISYDEQAKLKPRASYSEMTVPIELVLLESDDASARTTQRRYDHSDGDTLCP